MLASPIAIRSLGRPITYNHKNVMSTIVAVTEMFDGMYGRRPNNCHLYLDCITRISRLYVRNAQQLEDAASFAAE